RCRPAPGHPGHRSAAGLDGPGYVARAGDRHPAGRECPLHRGGSPMRETTTMTDAAENDESVTSETSGDKAAGGSASAASAASAGSAGSGTAGSASAPAPESARAEEAGAEA